MRYVVFTDRNRGVSFWTGELCSYGGPKLARNPDKAKTFRTPRAAYEEAGAQTHRDFFRLKVRRA